MGVVGALKAVAKDSQWAWEQLAMAGTRGYHS